MAKLNQIVAVVSGKKTRSEKEYGDLNKVLQKGDLFVGLMRTYRPYVDEAGERLPPEQKFPQMSVTDILSRVRALLAGSMDAVATQETGNQSTIADVVVNGAVVLKDVPVTVLLYLEKQMNDLATFVGNIPTIDPAEQWKWNDAQLRYETTPMLSIRTKKVQKGLVILQPTKEHPGQGSVITEDVNVGEWSAVKFSTAMTPTDKRNILLRITVLQDAIKLAREDANSISVEDVQIASSVLAYVFGS
jgi:hypothetical protein